MARKGRTEVIYKGTFISDQSLIYEWSLGMHEKRTLIVNDPSKIMKMQAHVLFSECTQNSGAK